MNTRLEHSKELAELINTLMYGLLLGFKIYFRSKGMNNTACIVLAILIFIGCMYCIPVFIRCLIENKRAENRIEWPMLIFDSMAVIFIIYVALRMIISGQDAGLIFDIVSSR